MAAPLRSSPKRLRHEELESLKTFVPFLSALPVVLYDLPATIYLEHEMLLGCPL